MDAPALAPLSDLLFALRRYHLALTVLLPAEPPADVLPTIGPHEFAIAMLLVEFKLTDVRAAVLVDERALSRQLVVGPLPM